MSSARSVRLGVWIPFRTGGALGAPSDLPLGRAALALRPEGIELVLGAPTASGCFCGVVATPTGWRPVEEVEVEAVYDRFPSASRPEDFVLGCSWLRASLANPPRVTALCRDKLACQRALEAAGIPMPTVEGEPERFAARLAEWGAAYIKPRHGSFGRGVRRVTPGDVVANEGVLQRAVEPAGPYMALRVLVQRSVDGGWLVRTPVARCSETDPVVNAARGAQVLPAPDLDLDLDAISSLARRVGACLSKMGEPFVEAGVDIVLDREHRPWVIEVNSRPRGRLRALAARDPVRFRTEHVDACAAPFRRLARVVREGTKEAP